MERHGVATIPQDFQMAFATWRAVQWNGTTQKGPRRRRDRPIAPPSEIFDLSDAPPARSPATELQVKRQSRTRRHSHHRSNYPAPQWANDTTGSSSNCPLSSLRSPDNSKIQNDQLLRRGMRGTRQSVVGQSHTSRKKANCEVGGCWDPRHAGSHASLVDTHHGCSSITTSPPGVQPHSSRRLHPSESQANLK